MAGPGLDHTSYLIATIKEVKLSNDTKKQLYNYPLQQSQYSRIIFATQKIVKFFATWACFQSLTD